MLADSIVPDGMADPTLAAVVMVDPNLILVIVGPSLNFAVAVDPILVVVVLVDPNLILVAVDPTLAVGAVPILVAEAVPTLVAEIGYYSSEQDTI